MVVKMGKVVAVCISDNKGTQKNNIHKGEFIADFGIKGDAHTGKWHRQVSLLSYEKINDFKSKGAEITDGSFGENLIVDVLTYAPCQLAQD
jgi:TatD DNase family protein